MAFYRAVFGYETHPFEAAGPDYATFHLPGDDAPLGGMGGMFGQDAPPHWLITFGVADTDAALASARGAGGRVAGPPMDTSYGRMGTVTDPFGATFMVVQLDGSNVPPER
jgi:hypothetical protein